jgi:hypothetical protein
MKMRRFLWVFLSMSFFLAALVNFLLCQHRLNDNFNQARQRLMLIASNSVISIDAQEVLKVPLERRSEGTPEYMVVYNKLVKIKETNFPIVRYVYIMTTTDQPGILQYVVDADPTPEIITARCPTSLPGDKYDVRQLPELLSAYDGPSADKKITADVWGLFISGYAPIHDASGKSIAILGVDMDASRIYALQKNVRVSGLLALAAFFIFLISLFGILIFRSKNIA